MSQDTYNPTPGGVATPASPQRYGVMTTTHSTDPYAPIGGTGWRLPEWPSQCRQDPDALFPENGRSPESATTPCRGCPVKAQCLEFALEGPWMPYGLWGGFTQATVQKLWLERHPRGRSDQDGVLTALGLK